MKEQKRKNKYTRGFTLVELMVSVSIFIIVMTISTGSILSVFDANRKTQSLRSVMDNLNFSLESMTRTIRFGTNYHCDDAVTPPPYTSPNDCLLGAPSIIVTDSDNNQVRYFLNANQIWRSINSGAASPMTSLDMSIQSLSFRVIGSLPYSDGANLFQPEVIIVIKGYASGMKIGLESSFNLETTVSQSQIDS